MLIQLFNAMSFLMKLRQSIQKANIKLTISDLGGPSIHVTTHDDNSWFLHADSSLPGGETGELLAGHEGAVVQPHGSSVYARTER